MGSFGGISAPNFFSNQSTIHFFFIRMSFFFEGFMFLFSKPNKAFNVLRAFLILILILNTILTAKDLIIYYYSIILNTFYLNTVKTNANHQSLGIFL